MNVHPLSANLSRGLGVVLSIDVSLLTVLLRDPDPIFRVRPLSQRDFRTTRLLVIVLPDELRIAGVRVNDRESVCGVVHSEIELVVVFDVKSLVDVKRLEIGTGLDALEIAVPVRHARMFLVALLAASLFVLLIVGVERGGPALWLGGSPLSVAARNQCLETDRHMGHCRVSGQGRYREQCGDELEGYGERRGHYSCERRSWGLMGDGVCRLDGRGASWGPI